MSNSRDSEVIRWRRHTPRSRAFAWAGNLLVLAGMAMVWVGGVGIGYYLGMALVLAGIVGTFLMRREMTVVLRPRPRRPTDTRDFGQLLAMQFGLMLVAWPVMIWFGVQVGAGRATLPLTLAAIAALIASVFGNLALRRAYERLFDRVAKKDGAYGL